MRNYRKLLLVPALGLAGLLAAVVPGQTSSHREAPRISEDPLADTTDVYAFVSPDRPDTVTFIANWIPLEEPAGGPNFFKFGDDVRYRINIDNNGDAADDIIYEWRFTTKVVNPNTFLYNTGPITSLNDPHFNIRQYYSVAKIQGDSRKIIGEGLATPPVNIGPRSTPNYEALARSAVYDLPGGYKSFVGQRDDPFFVDLGSIFDLGGLRPLNSAHALPPEYEGRADDYIDAVCAWLPALHAEGLVDAVDAFCERIGFTPAQTRRVFAAARELHLPVKLHAEQLSDQHGAALAGLAIGAGARQITFIPDNVVAALPFDVVAWPDEIQLATESVERNVCGRTAICLGNADRKVAIREFRQRAHTHF